MGPSCCCCQDVYIRGGTPERVNGKDGSLVDSAAGGSLADTIYFDLVNKKLYVQTNDNLRVKRYDQDLTNYTTILTAGSSERYDRGIAVHPQGDHIYFGRNDNPKTNTRYLTRTAYDGTGQTDIQSFNNGSTVGGNILDLAVTRDDEYVFYTKRHATTGDSIRRCNSDGTGDIEVFAATGLLNFGINVDNGREKIQFSYNSTGSTFLIKRCDWDGANLETLYTATSPDVIRFAGYSHSKDRHYFWNDSSTAGRDSWCSLAQDGSDFQREILASVWAGNDSPVWCKLGCGYETLGAGTLGS